jgi:hypothetical protein
VKQQPSYALYILRRLSYRTGSIPCLLRDIPKIPLIFASASLPLLRAPLAMRGHTMGHHLYHPGGISCLLVKEGWCWCWWNRKYAIGETELEGLEKSAREAKKSLWTDPRPMPPWEWRTLRRDPPCLTTPTFCYSASRLTWHVFCCPRGPACGSPTLVPADF